MRLDGSVALVLGGVKGIGKGIALALAARGVHVAVNYFDWQGSLEDLERDLAATGGHYRIYRTDLLETAKIGDLVEKVFQWRGRLDILINNIERGGWPVVHGPYIESQWDLELATTLRAKQWVFEAALPHLKASGDGAVVNLSSIAGVVGRNGPASYIFNEGYAAANRGIALLTETWARRGAPNVRVNEIMLGIFETRHGPQTRGWGLLSADQRQAVINHTLVERTGRVEDVVKALLFVLCDAAYMTGSVLKLDGGYTLGGEVMAPMPQGVL